MHVQISITFMLRVKFNSLLSINYIIPLDMVSQLKLLNLKTCVLLEASSVYLLLFLIIYVAGYVNRILILNLSIKILTIDIVVDYFVSRHCYLNDKSNIIFI